MYSYFHGQLPFSFNEIWVTNRAGNPNLELRNADNLYVPSHNCSTPKRFPLYSFPRIWNEESVMKYNPAQSAYLKSVKSVLLNAITVWFSYILAIPPPSPLPPLLEQYTYSNTIQVMGLD
jgi:hypothetical protein